MDTNTFNLLVTIGKCHVLLKRHADGLLSRAAVKTVKHWCDMPSLHDAFRLEEYVDAELVNGEAVSWCLELTITLEGVLLEADVRRIHHDGQDVVAEIANREFKNVEGCLEEIFEITQRLCASSDL